MSFPLRTIRCLEPELFYPLRIIRCLDQKLFLEPFAVTISAQVRQVSRSPPTSKHSHRRHSPYSSTERRRRSRSTSPGHRRSSTHKRSS